MAEPEKEKAQKEVYGSIFYLDFPGRWVNKEGKVKVHVYSPNFFTEDCWRVVTPYGQVFDFEGNGAEHRAFVVADTFSRQK